MNFADAVNNMINGKKLVRPKYSGLYLAILDGQNYIWEIGVNGSQAAVNAKIFIPSLDDILATDYSVKV